MISITWLLSVMLGYMGMLFVIARWGESQSAMANKVARHPVTYGLSLAIYCTSWTFYGLVGMATSSGYLYMALFLGPCLAMIFSWSILRRLIAIKNHFRITSMADFLAARYNKSNTLGTITALMALVGSVPYISIQLKAIIVSFNELVAFSNPSPTEKILVNYFDWFIVIIMIFFTIIFGVRRLDPTERHQGMMLSLATESIVKLLALVSIGLFVCYSLFDGVGDVFESAQMHQQAHPVIERMAAALPGELWITLLLLGIANFLFLPRQFHVAVIENHDPNHIKTAQWMLPLYLFIITSLVVPIALASLMTGLPSAEADSFVLLLPLWSQALPLSFFIFIGGFSAAMGMIMVSSMTLSTMVTNNVILPIVERLNICLFLRRHLLVCRWVVVAGIILSSYIFYLTVSESYMLAKTGLISFVATLQFAPAIIGGLFWKRGNHYGAITAILVGFAVWFYTMVLPALVQSGWLPIELMQASPDELTLIEPQALFGTSGLNPLTHTVFWSLLANITAYIVVSLYTTTSREELMNANLFTAILEKDELQHLRQEKNIPIDKKVNVIKNIYKDYFSEKIAQLKLEETLLQESLTPTDLISILQLSQLINTAESTLAGSIGAASAHIAFKRSDLVSEQEYQALSATYADVLAELNISPQALKEKVDYYQARDDLYKENAVELEQQVQTQTTALKATNEHLLKTLVKLNDTQKSLVEADKLAALGGLVAGVAHEINTPLGISITAVSHLDDTAHQFKNKFESGQLTKLDFTKFIETSDESIRILITNTSKAAELIKSFKQIAVDQSSEVKRRFNLKHYFDEILLSLKPKFKHTPLTVNVKCDTTIEINSYPGALSQVITNLITNSLTHAFGPLVQDAIGHDDLVQRDIVQKTITITATRQQEQITLTYSDNGVGMSKEALEHLFEPFFTTKRGSGGSGLGAHIIYNLVVQKLNGTIECQSIQGEGTQYTIHFPVEAQ